VGTSDDDLIELAGAILDGSAVDWGTVETDPDVDPDLLHQLRIVADLAQVHRSDPIAHTRRDHPALAGVDPSALPQWGPLLVLERVGHGSFGDVFRAWDTRLEREVALKLIEATGRPEEPLAAIDEGRLLARIRHPNVLAVYGAERIGPQVGIWTEFIHGRTLAQILAAEGPFTSAAAAAIGVEICSALDAVHAAGLLHRDIKAQNVMREDGGRIVLMDFGAGAEHAVEGSGAGRTVAGTPLYVAPELLGSGRPTPQSDVYSVGILLFHLVTGSFPVNGRSLEEVAKRHSNDARLALSRARPSLPRDFVAIVNRAIEPDPSRRFNTARLLRDALAASTGDLPEDATPSSRRPVWVAGGVAVALCAAILVLGAEGGLLTRVNRRFDAGQGLAGATPMSMRRVATPAMGLNRAGTPSFDGRLYSNADINLDLQVFDLASGVSRRLTDRQQAKEMAEFSAVSPEGSQVAYSWLTSADAYELRLVGVEDRQSRVLVPAGRVLNIIPIEWSRDASAVLCLVHQARGHFQMGLVSVATGALRIISDFGPNQPQHMTLSKDGRFVAYDFPASAGERDIVIQSVDGSVRHLLISHPADDVSPVWTPDGRHLLFLSNRSGTYDGWIVETANGSAVGEPAMVVRNVGEVVMAGFTSAGALYYWRRSGDMDVFTRSIDAGTAGRAERVPSRIQGANSAPAWSPDGRFLAYLSRRDPEGSAARSIVVIHPLSGGRDREIPIALKTVGPAVLRWSPDGHEILLSGQDDEGHTGAFVLQTAYGVVRPAIVAVDGSPNEAVRGAHWWIDGRSIAWISGDRIVVGQPGAHDARVVYRPGTGTHPLRLDNFEISPDRRSLAMAGWLDGTDPLEGVLLIAPIGGVPYELLRTTSPAMVSLQGWSPDGRSLLVTRRDSRNPAPHSLWRVWLDGTARDTGVRIPGFTQVNRVQIDPRGVRIAYAADQVRWEIWVLEHFLPDSAQ
jgi:serine/threonine protein kinase